MMSVPTFSIIIPSFNAAGTIAQTLKSVITQSETDYELLVIDGGSNDGTSDVLEAYLPHIRYFISEKDTGVYDAMNKGIQAARGGWIYLMGADDAFADDGVLAAVKETIHTAPSAQLIFGNVRQVNAAHPLVPTVHQSHFGNGLYWKNTLHSQSCFYQKSLLQKFPFNTEYNILADYDIHLALWLENTPYIRLDRDIAVCGATGISKNFTPSLYREEWRVKRRRLGFVRALPQAVWVWVKYSIKKAWNLTG